MPTWPRPARLSYVELRPGAKKRPAARKPDGLATRAGRYGWNGGLGSSWWNDPNERLTAIIVTERTFESADPPNVIKDFWKSAYEAVRTGS